MIIRIISIILTVLAVGFFIALIVDAVKHKEEVKTDAGSIPLMFFIEMATWFLGTFGVSDTAMNMLLFRLFKVTDTRKLPGTIVAGAAIPLCIMSVAYLGVAEVDPVTLVILVCVTGIGGLAGAVLVSKLDIQVVRLIMAVVLMATAVILLAKMFLRSSEGGMATGLTGGKLILAAVLMFIMECLVMIGFGNTVPSMSMLLMMGINPLTVFPMVMSSCSVGSVMGCVGFIKNGTYNRKIAITEAVGGSIGVLIAVKLISGMDIKILQFLMIAIIIYNAYMMFGDYRAAKKNEQCD